MDGSNIMMLCVGTCNEWRNGQSSFAVHSAGSETLKVCDQEKGKGFLE